MSIYEHNAATYARNRPARFGARAAALAACATSPLVDLGCGPGGYGTWLARSGAAVVGIDAARAMVASASAHERCVLGDLQALPFTFQAFGGAWARNSYLHVRGVDLPMALAHLHHALRVGAPMALAMVLGEDFVSADDLPGRRFTGWREEPLQAVVAGAGFEDVAVERVDEAPGQGMLWVTARRARTLPDFVGPSMRLLVCGLNPSLTAADAGFGFAGRSNRFWRAAVAAQVLSRMGDPWHALARHQVGMTDLVKRATRRADEVADHELATGFARLTRLVRWLHPEAVCFVGLQGWRAAVNRFASPGWQPEGVGGAPAYVMPSSSGLNTHTRLDELSAHLVAATGRRVPPGTGGPTA